MQISAKILADSTFDGGPRITTLELHYHRYILPEFNTHRAFSRNGASSRAIPTHKLIEQAIAERVEPLEWGLNQAGMQAFTVADEALEAEGRAIWDEARASAIFHATRLNDKGFAKQIVNRVLEPFLSTRTVVTSTDWANFMALRDHKDAQPEIRELARQIIAAMEGSKPALLQKGQWHLPYILPEDYDRIHKMPFADRAELTAKIKPLLNWVADAFIFGDADLILLMVSAARCARVSYRTVEGTATEYLKDLELFDRLVRAQPVHASPTEHQASPYAIGRDYTTANYRNWAPFRRMLEGETVHDKLNTF